MHKIYINKINKSQNKISDTENKISTKCTIYTDERSVQYSVHTHTIVLNMHIHIIILTCVYI